MLYCVYIYILYTYFYIYIHTYAGKRFFLEVTILGLFKIALRLRGRLVFF